MTDSKPLEAVSHFVCDVCGNWRQHIANDKQSSHPVSTNEIANPIHCFQPMRAVLESEMKPLDVLASDLLSKFGGQIGVLYDVQIGKGKKLYTHVYQARNSERIAVSYWKEGYVYRGAGVYVSADYPSVRYIDPDTVVHLIPKWRTRWLKSRDTE